jgi:hypothetical protein
MAIEGVLGVAIGRTPIGDDALVLYLRDPSVERRVPPEVEGLALSQILNLDETKDSYWTDYAASE